MAGDMYECPGCRGAGRYSSHCPGCLTDKCSSTCTRRCPTCLGNREVTLEEARAFFAGRPWLAIPPYIAHSLEQTGVSIWDLGGRA